MEKLPVKIIALDLDDTLLNAKTQITDLTVKALQKCAERGIYVTLCSGRAEDGILPFVRQLNIAGTEAGRFLIATNGCSVFDLHTRTQIYRKSVEAEVLLEADKMAEEMGLQTEVYSPDTIFYRLETKWTKLDVELCHLKGKVIDDYTSFLANKKNSFPKMLIPGEPEKLQVLQEKYRKAFGNRAVVFVSKPYFLELLPPACGKGEALLWLAEKLGIPKENTMAFGDSMNDESMICLTEYGVAMKNGFEEVKQIASFVTDYTNEEDGVGRFLEKYVL